MINGAFLSPWRNAFCCFNLSIFFQQIKCLHNRLPNGITRFSFQTFSSLARKTLSKPFPSKNQSRHFTVLLTRKIIRSKTLSDNPEKSGINVLQNAYFLLDFRSYKSKYQYPSSFHKT